MEKSKITCSKWILSWALFIVLLTTPWALGQGEGETPEFIYCSSVSNYLPVRSTFAELKNSVRFSGVYFDPEKGESVPLKGAGTTYTDTPMFLSEGYEGETIRNWATMSSYPLLLRGSILNDAWTNPQGNWGHSFVNTTSGAARWYVLRGAEGPVSLRADILFKGQLFGTPTQEGDNVGAYFTHFFGVISHPSNLITSFPIIINGGSVPIGANCGPFGNPGTVPDVCFNSDGNIHPVNYIVRSNPFLVIPEIPFRLHISLNAAAFTNGLNELSAYSDFVDAGLVTSAQFGLPELTPEGFVVDLDGNPDTRDVTPLSSLGYTLHPILQPSTLFLLREESPVESEFSVTLRSQGVTLTDTPVTGTLNGTLSLTEMTFVTITTGVFAGKGFFKGKWEATFEGIPYKGVWEGMFYSNPGGDRIYLKGILSGDLVGATEGYLIESAEGSGVCDQLQMVWMFNEIKGNPYSGKIVIGDKIAYQTPTLHPQTRLYYLYTSAGGNLSGESDGPLNTRISHVRVKEANHPYDGLGFSWISLHSPSGSGEGWTYDQLVLPGLLKSKGMVSGLFRGTLISLMDENHPQRVLTGMIRRVDAGLPPMADLVVETWSTTAASPGETVTYFIQYRNRGLTTAENVIIINRLPPMVNYNSSAKGGIYNPESHEVFFNIGTVPPKAKGVLYVHGTLTWGVWQYSPLWNAVFIGTSSSETDIYLWPGTTALTEEWAEAQIARADNDYDVRNPPPGYDPDDPNWEGIGPYSLRDRILEAIELIKKYDPVMGEYIQALYDKGKIHIDPDLSPSSLWDANPGVNHMYIMGDDVKWGVSARFNDQAWETFKWKECWLPKLAGIILHEARHSDGQLFPGWAKGETEAFATEGAFHLKLLKDLYLNKRYQHAEALLNHMRLYRWRDLEDRAKEGLYKGILKWKKALEYAQQMLRELEELQSLADEGNFEEVYAKIDTLYDFLRSLGKLPEEESLENASQTFTWTLYAWDPNVKYGPQGEVSPGERLYYEIEYENVGLGKAFGVYFTDVLDENLDETTLEIGPVRRKKDNTIIAPAGTYHPEMRMITWYVGEVGPGEGGYAQISVKVRENAADGTEILNYGTIYFPSVPQVTPTPGIVSIVSRETQKRITSLGPATAWIGLLNTKDRGANFDLRAEVYLNDSLIGAGETLCITGVTSNPEHAREVEIPIHLLSEAPFAMGDTLSLRILTRIGTTSKGKKCASEGGKPGKGSAKGLRLYYDALNRASGFGAGFTPYPLRDFFLHSEGSDSFDTTPPVGNTAKYKDSEKLNFLSKKNPWKEIGRWSRKIP